MKEGEDSSCSEAQHKSSLMDDGINDIKQQTLPVSQVCVCCFCMCHLLTAGKSVMNILQIIIFETQKHKFSCLRHTYMIVWYKIIFWNKSKCS